MDLSASILGTDIVKELTDRRMKHILQIGRDGLTRRDLSRVDCFNFLAAQNLSYRLNKELAVKNIADVFYNVHPHKLALPRVGSIALAVLGAAFEAKRLGGSRPLEAWMKRHSCEIRTFTTIKLNEQKEEAEERKRLKSRRSARRNQAHHLRVSRHEERSVAAAT